MKLFTMALLLIPPAFAQMTNLPCIPPPAPAPTSQTPRAQDAAVVQAPLELRPSHPPPILRKLTS